MSQSSVTNLPLPIVCSQKNADGTSAAFAVQVISGNLSAPTSTISCAGLSASGVINANSGLIATSMTSLGATTLGVNPANAAIVTTLLELPENILAFVTTTSEAYVPANGRSGFCLGWNTSDGDGETNFINLAQGGEGGYSFQTQNNNNAATTMLDIRGDGSTFSMPIVINTATHGLAFTNLACVPAAADDAAAQAAGVPVGGVYRTNADPSVLCIRAA